MRSSIRVHHRVSSIQVNDGLALLYYFANLIEVFQGSGRGSKKKIPHINDLINDVCRDIYEDVFENNKKAGTEGSVRGIQEVLSYELARIILSKILTTLFATGATGGLKQEKIEEMLEVYLQAEEELSARR